VPAGPITVPPMLAAAGGKRERGENESDQNRSHHGTAPGNRGVNTSQCKAAWPQRFVSRSNRAPRYHVSSVALNWMAFARADSKKIFHL
jgi:hypothetical protein